MEAAKSNQVYSNFHAAAKCAPEFGSEPNTINIFRQFDTQHIVYRGPAQFDNLIAWLADSSIPNVITFDEDYVSLLFGQGQGRDALILFTNDASGEGLN